MKIRAALLPAALLLYGTLAVSSMRTKSAVFDETAHLPAGYTYLKVRDFRLNPEHPPLAKELAALPLLWIEPRVREVSESWQLHQQFEFGHRFLYRWNDGDRLLFWGRVPIVLLGGALAAAVFLWTRRRFGIAAAAIALLLSVLSPDMLAHGQVVTTDIAISLFLFLSVISFRAVSERVTVRRVILTGLAIGAAFASKFSAFALIPTLAMLSIWVAFSPAALVVAVSGLRPRAVTGGGRKLAVLALSALGMAAVALALLWTTYAYQPRLAGDADAERTFEWWRIEPEEPRLAAAVRIARAAGVLPDAYLYGLVYAFRSTKAHPAFLCGQISYQGWWYYFPTTFLLKTPLALLGILALPLAARGKPAGPRLGPFVWLPVLVYVAASLTRNLNIGHRHLLPIYPFLFVAAGVAGAAAWAGSGHRRWAVVALCVWYAGSVLRVHPHYLAYFNELAGGPSGGWRYLVDSNLDWGQDLRGLKRWMDDHGVARVKLSYFGTADPDYYHLQYEMLPSFMPVPPTAVVHEVRAGEVVAVSATNLQGVFLGAEVRPLMARLRGLRPIDRVGYSIFIYRPDFSMSVP
jgi:dolichyl-phosphate-mannose-protein mannosyltransferase